MSQPTVTIEEVRELAKARPRYARGARKQRGVMNGTEQKFLNNNIMPMVANGEVIEWWYEKWAWTLTEKTPGGKPGIRYTPDFVCMLATGELVAYEVKGIGNARRQDLNRTKLFADRFPIHCYVATLRRKKDGSGFKIEEY